MAVVEYKKYFLSFRHIWFDAEMANKEAECDVMLYSAMANPPKGYGKNVFIRYKSTLLNDLSPAQEELWSALRKETKYKINRAEREGVYTEVFDAKDLKGHQSLLDELDQVYSGLIKFKKLPRRYKMNRRALEAYINADMLILTRAGFENRPLVYHTYLLQGDTVRLHYSASIRDTEDTSMKSLIGRANRLLHWRDMILFKERGYRQYDWGGYINEPEAEGVNRFKDGFGGTVVFHYHYAVPRSLLGYLAVLGLNLNKAINSIRKRRKI